MSAPTTDATLEDDLQEQQPTICCSPSCWAEGEPIEIAESGEDPPVLCESCRKQYLGVSS